MADPDFDGFYIVWLDDKNEVIGDEWINKKTFESAVRAVGLRIYQSPHTCPPGIAGFYVEHIHQWRERHGKPPISITRGAVE